MPKTPRLFEKLESAQECLSWAEMLIRLLFTDDEDGIDGTGEQHLDCWVDMVDSLPTQAHRVRQWTASPRTALHADTPR